MNTQITTLAASQTASYLFARHLIVMLHVRRNPFVVVVHYFDQSETLQTAYSAFPTAGHAELFAQHMRSHAEVVDAEVEYRFSS